MKDVLTVTFWYVEPIGAYTNKVFSENLPAEDTCPDTITEDGKPRNLWRCTHFFLQRCEQTRAELDLKFRAYVQHGPHGKIRPWKFGAKAMPVRLAA